MEWAKDNFDERIKSPFWWSMIVTWLTWNWKVWYVTFFIKHEHLGIDGNKIDYIKELYNYFDFYNLFPCLGILFHWLLMPLILSWFIIIFVTPKISHWFLEKHKANKIAENEIKIQEINSETKVLEAEEQKVEKEQDIEKIKEKSEEEKWDDEYDKISKNHNLMLKNIWTLIFNYNWDDASYDSDINDWTYNIDINDIKNWVLFNLIDIITREKHWNVYQLTKKGKYFLKKYALEQPKKENS